MGRRQQNILFAFFFFLVLSIWSYIHQIHTSHQPSLSVSPTPTTVATASAVLGQRTKSSDCTTQQALPDPDCTPGATFPTVTVQQICTPGYAHSVRNVPEIEKKQVYMSYGIYSHVKGQYEVDHLISLELGGSNDISNLWPEPAEPRPGFHEKDLVENYLHALVCNGKMTLQEAQEKIVKDWVYVYQQTPDITSYENNQTRSE